MIHKNWLELIKPTQLVVKPGADAQRTATVYAEPLERGFGLTLGNALRRVLMSSLQGGAITSVQIDNVLHEFSSVAGVREDVTDIVLNLKGVSIKMEVDGPKRLSISAKGPGVVTAGDISETNGIEVLNKEHVICHLDEGATLNMELVADTGKGYVPAVANRPIDAPIGRARGNDWKFAVTEGGRHSITHYDTVEAFVAASLLDVHLETGRTHQIRVHFSALHHPCCGDLTYGADPTLAKKLGLERQWLHARSLGFAHPADGRWFEITSEYPPELQHALDVLHRQ